jgi:hypothetical protein
MGSFAAGAHAPAGEAGKAGIDACADVARPRRLAVATQLASSCSAIVRGDKPGKGWMEMDRTGEPRDCNRELASFLSVSGGIHGTDRAGWFARSGQVSCLSLDGRTERMASGRRVQALVAHSWKDCYFSGRFRFARPVPVLFPFQIQRLLHMSAR